MPVLPPSHRPVVSVFIATSLDGFIARDDDSIDWLQSVELPGEDYGYAALLASIDTLVMGRRTWQTVLGFGGEWPWPDKHVVVQTRGRYEAPHGEWLTDLPPEDLAAELFRRGCRHVYLDGGQLIRSWLQAGLVDELTISVLPRLLGRGVALFGPELAEQPLQLVSSQAYASGLVQLRYRLATLPEVAEL